MPAPSPPLERVHLTVIGLWAALVVTPCTLFMVYAQPGGFVDRWGIVFFGLVFMFAGLIVLALFGLVAKSLMTGKAARAVFLVIGPFIVAIWFVPYLL